jgi:hypothetical protein
MRPDCTAGMGPVGTNGPNYMPIAKFRWYDRLDHSLWVSEGIERRVCVLQQWWTNTTAVGSQGEWRDVPTEVEGRG